MNFGILKRKSDFAKAKINDLSKSKSKTIDLDEWLSYWENCKNLGISDNEIINELSYFKQADNWISFRNLDPFKDL